jgi:hypothetical protein
MIEVNGHAEANAETCAAGADAGARTAARSFPAVSIQA